MQDTPKYSAPTEAEIWRALQVEAAATVPFGSGQTSEHGYSCRCESCKVWWIGCGPEDITAAGVLTFGPFSEAEILARLGGDAAAVAKMEGWRRALQGPDEPEELPEQDDFGPAA